MEDQGPPIDAHLRGKALQFVLQLYASWGPDDEGDKDVESTLERADEIYKFLKGESK